MYARIQIISKYNIYISFAMVKANHFPATLAVFPEGCNARRAAFYLAAEEYLAETIQKCNTGCFLFTWILSPTVVYGRNQVLQNEINLEFCRDHNIDVIRRKSGGGTIYADGGNIMISLITEGGPVEPLFQEYSQKIAEMLTSFGAPATATGRNDIIVEPQSPDIMGSKSAGKVCGNAFYHLANSNIVHGTMLYDTDFEMMMGALIPPTEKLKRHGVESVRQRVALLKDYLTFGVEELKNKIEGYLTSNVLELNETDVLEIERIEQWYYKEI